MKLYLSLIYSICLFISFSLYRSSNTHSNTEFNLQNHLTMLMKMKTKTKTMLENLYLSANRVDLENFNKPNNKQGQTRLINAKSPVKSQKSSHFSKLHHKQILKPANYRQYRYLNYEEIVNKLKELSKKYPNYLKLTTAQKLYNLPYPGGFCDTNRKIKCKHYIAFLTNHKLNKSGKHQMYISGEVHGDERVGPTATIELIKLMLENKHLPWFNFLLNTRYIVITPMTNPHGYFDKIREELLIKDEDSIVLTKKMYDKTHKDINRDFPYLVKPKACMETIGARVVNELFINHLFSLALSLHGGTESLTYPYGTPNHLVTNRVPKLDAFYTMDQGKKVINPTRKAMKVIKKFRRGLYEMERGKSTNPPDYNAVKSIAETASDHTTNIPGKKYKTGDMNGEVYSVTGGMEDWAYSGSWEGFPIITQPCDPTTYKGYESKKTMYDKFYKDSLKSIMFLLEVSNEKVPEQKHLGRENLDCIVNLRSNAFFNQIASNKKTCLDDYIDGYIPRIIRLSLTLIDILHPYINFKITRINKNAKVVWTVGGAIDVDATSIIYRYFDKKPDDAFFKKIETINDINILTTIFNHSTGINKGKAVWNINYTAKDRFSHLFEFSKNKNKYLVFIVIARVDKNWSLKNHPDPDVNPQTHIANFRNDANYVASNGKYTIKGQDFFKSEVGVIDILNN